MITKRKKSHDIFKFIFLILFPPSHINPILSVLLFQNTEKFGFTGMQFGILCVGRAEIYTASDRVDCGQLLFWSIRQSGNKKKTNGALLAGLRLGF